MGSLPIRISECLDALYHCHTNNSVSEESVAYQAPLPENFEIRTAHASAIYGPQIAQRFATEAAKRLSQEQFRQLLQFLRYPTRVEIQNKESLEQVLAHKLQDFYSAEVRISGEGRDRLARPGGPPDADLGLILHVQSEDDVIGEFWDPRSATINLLQEKGVNKNFAFGYDWHWRAQASFHRKARCPTLAWNQRLKALHDHFSADLLDMLPLPFIITASSCTRDNLRKYLIKSAMSLEIELVPPAGVLIFDLDFRNGTLRRIILHIHHPTAGFFASRKNRGSMAIQIDAGTNFFLWLIGKDHNPTSFVSRCSSKRPRSIKTAPLPEMWAYVKKEAAEGRKLQLEDYSPSFLSWATRYLGQDSVLVLAAGISLACTAADKIVSRIHKRSAERSMSSSSITQKKIAVSSRLDNQESERHPQQGQKTDTKRKAPVAAPQGATSNILSSIPPVPFQGTGSSSPDRHPHARPKGSKKQLQKNLGDQSHKEEHRQQTPSEILRENSEKESKEQSQKGFCQEESQQQTFFETLQEKSYQVIQQTLSEIAQEKSENGSRKRSWEEIGDGLYQEGLQQTHSKTLERKSENALNFVNDGSTNNSITESAEHPRKELNFISYRPLVDQIDIPMPLDDLYEDDDEDQGLTTETETDFDEAVEPRTCHRTPVKVCRNGTVKISGAAFPLHFRTSIIQAQKIRAFGGTPSIYITPTDIEIRVDGKAVYTKPIERLLASFEGAEWLCQLIHEKTTLQGTLHEDKYAEAEPQSDLRLIPHKVQGCAWKNGELKRKLRQGANFHCAELKNRGVVTEHRVYFRGAQISVPLEANPQTVFVQASLVPEGTVHPHECINGGEVSDPAHRLGIKVKYRIKDGNTEKEFWSRSSGDCNVKKLNSIVDFLEDKDDVWTENQPRRFIDKNHARKRFKTSYTS